MKLPNGPQTPARLQMLQWIVRPFALMKTCAQRYGDMFTLTANVSHSIYCLRAGCQITHRNYGA
jgi:hypothetical protein